MKMRFWHLCLLGIAGGALVTSPLSAADDITQKSAQNGQSMTETDLLAILNDKDKATYQSLSPSGKALVLKLAKTATSSQDMTGNCLAMLKDMANKFLQEIDETITQMQDKISPQESTPAPTPPSNTPSRR